MGLKSLSLASLACSLCVVVAACSGGQAVSDQSGGGGRGAGRAGRGASGGGGVPVTTTPVVQKAMPLRMKLIGTVEAIMSVSIRSQITGVLDAVNFKQGDDVRQGQPLFSLDRRPLEATLRQVQATLERDRAQAANARVIAQRYADLAKRGIATQEQVETSRASAAALEATVGADEAAVENAKVQLQYATIPAPISGRTGALAANIGNLVRVNDTAALVVINQLSPIFVSFAVPEAQLPDFKRYIAEGSVLVEAGPPGEPDPVVRGRISFVDNAIDQSTGTIKMRATVQNEKHALLPGQFVNVVVTLTTDPAAVVVPSVAVQTGPNGQYVYVVKPDQTVDMRPVEMSRIEGTEAVIKTGLKGGEVVVTDGHLRLVPGSTVSAKGAEKVAS
jgi:membrane fusion protein, multidrug efflux system